MGTPDAVERQISDLRYDPDPCQVHWYTETKELGEHCAYCRKPKGALAKVLPFVRPSWR